MRGGDTPILLFRGLLIATLYLALVAGQCSQRQSLFSYGSTGVLSFSGDFRYGSNSLWEYCANSYNLWEVVYVLYMPQPWYYYLYVMAYPSFPPSIYIIDAYCGGTPIACANASYYLYQPQIMGGATRSLVIDGYSSSRGGTYISGSIYLYYASSCDWPDSLGSISSGTLSTDPSPMAGYAQLLSPTCSAWPSSSSERVYTFTLQVPSMVNVTAITSTGSPIATYIRTVCSVSADLGCSTGYSAASAVVGLNAGTYYAVVDTTAAAFRVVLNSDPSGLSWCGNPVTLSRLPHRAGYTGTALLSHSGNGLSGYCASWSGGTSEVVFQLAVPVIGMYWINISFPEAVNASAPDLTPIAVYVRTQQTCTTASSEFICALGTVAHGVFLSGYYQAPGNYDVIVDGAPAHSANLTSVNLRSYLGTESRSLRISGTSSSTQGVTQTLSMTKTGSSTRASTASPSLSLSGKTPSRSPTIHPTFTASPTTTRSFSREPTNSRTESLTEGRTLTSSSSHSYTGDGTLSTTRSFTATSRKTRTRTPSLTRTSRSESQSASRSFPETVTNERTKTKNVTQTGATGTLTLSHNATKSVSAFETCSTSVSLSTLSRSRTWTIPLPPPSPLAALQSAATDTGAAVNTVASATSLGNPSAGPAAGRVSSLLLMSNCRQATAQKSSMKTAPQQPMSWTDHPTGIAFPAAGVQVQYHAGLVVGNMAIAAGVVVVHLLATAAKQMLNARAAAAQGIEASPTPWRQAAATCRFPGFTIPVQGYLVSLIATSATECVTRGNAVGAIIGLWGLLCVCCATFAVAYYTVVVLSNAMTCATTESDRKAEEESTPTSPSTRLLLAVVVDDSDANGGDVVSVEATKGQSTPTRPRTIIEQLFLPATEWRLRREETLNSNPDDPFEWSAAQLRSCFGAYFEDYNERGRWWLTVELSCSIAAGIAGGLIEVVPCAVAAWIGVGPLLAFLALYIAVRPFQRRADSASTFLSALLTAAGGIAAGVGASNESDLASATAAMCGVLASIVVAFPLCYTPYRYVLQYRAIMLMERREKLEARQRAKARAAEEIRRMEKDAKAEAYAKHRAAKLAKVPDGMKLLVDSDDEGALPVEQVLPDAEEDEALAQVKNDVVAQLTSFDAWDASTTRRTSADLDNMPTLLVSLLGEEPLPSPPPRSSHNETTRKRRNTNVALRPVNDLVSLIQSPQTSRAEPSMDQVLDALLDPEATQRPESNFAAVLEPPATASSRSAAQPKANPFSRLV